MKLFITLLKGLLIAGGMVLLMGFVIGTSSYLHEVGAESYALIPYITGMGIFAFLGFVLRRWVWPERKQVWKITGAGFLFFMLLQLALGLFISGSRGWAGVMDSMCMVMGLYVLCFWLPFAIGILAGGFRREATAHAGKEPTIA